MCLEIGNKVAVLDADIRGVIIKKEEEQFIIKDIEGMEYAFLASELVKINVEQNELSKYIDINNPLLREKVSQKNKQKKSIFIKDKNEVVMEVDLHIEKIVKSVRGMDKYDILYKQIQLAKQKVEYCVSKGISKLVLIHGVGEGVLKSELEYLLNNYNVRYYEASYQKYGQGATEIYIYQNVN
ncbi:Smr/MutS family protein [uncultured Tenacibaculum sp.]|uniref:Smr/MutS family protein n=1 Tax=uncultured Tenacibaculum sp. TaxID=174713 RepID=UPI002605E1E8|nr:Smr/MutS family protein [uncultured Tenacibaculum sp.]